MTYEQAMLLLKKAQNKDFLTQEERARLQEAFKIVTSNILKQPF